MQKFGDVYPRNYLSMLVSHYLNQKEALKKEFHELGGFVLILGALSVATSRDDTPSISISYALTLYAYVSL